MSASIGILKQPTIIGGSARPAIDIDKESPVTSARLREYADTFAKEQLRGLVRQVFFPGSAGPVRQVVFSSIDQTDEIARICARVAEVLTSQVPGDVCVVEANLRSPALHKFFGAAIAADMNSSGKSDLRDGSRRISRNLWFIPSEMFLGEAGNSFPAAWVRSRLSELRHEFEYTMIHAAPAGLYSDTALLGQLSDGVILTLEAHRTRRIAARRTGEKLQAANVRLLGMVLNQRTFPIPEGIYRKL